MLVLAVVDSTFYVCIFWSIIQFLLSLLVVFLWCCFFIYFFYHKIYVWKYPQIDHNTQRDSWIFCKQKYLYTVYLEKCRYCILFLVIGKRGWHILCVCFFLIFEKTENKSQIKECDSYWAFCALDKGRTRKKTLHKFRKNINVHIKFILYLKKY